jgi:predicted NUDIX family phosphoesterase
MEFVFVVPRTALFPEFYPHGFVPFATPPAEAEAARSASSGSSISLEAFERVIEREGFFVERAYAENTPSLKQIIPYSVVRCDGPTGPLVLCTRRLARGGESRLHDKHSIGIGGHINPEDMPAAAAPFAAASDVASKRDARSTRARNPLDAGTQREIGEELAVRGGYEVRRLGLINDDSNPVGAVHVGVVQLVTVSGAVEIRERDLLEGELVTYEELQRRLARGVNFETWSKLLIPHLDGRLPHALAVLS